MFINCDQRQCSWSILAHILNHLWCIILNCTTYIIYRHRQTDRLHSRQDRDGRVFVVSPCDSHGLCPLCFACYVHHPTLQHCRGLLCPMCPAIHRRAIITMTIAQFIPTPAMYIPFKTAVRPSVCVSFIHHKRH